MSPMTREYQLIQTDEHDYKLRASPLLLLVPAAIGYGVHQLSARVDTPLLSENGNSLDNQDFFYPATRNILNGSNQWDASIATEAGLDKPNVARDVVPLKSTEDTVEIAGAILGSAKTMVENSPSPLLIDAVIYDPANSKIDFFASSDQLAANDKDVATPASNAALIYYRVSTGIEKPVEADSLIEKIHQEFSNSNTWRGGGQAPLLFPQYEADIIMPYTISQYTAMFNLAQANGFSNIEFLNSEIEDRRNEELRKQAEEIMKAPGERLHDPAVILKATVDSSKSSQADSAPAVPTTEISQQVCEVKSHHVNETYHLLQSEQISNPVSVTGVTLLATAALIAARVKRQRRIIGGAEVPQRAVQESVEAGTASTEEKLHVLAYRQALSKSHNQALPIGRALTRLIKPIAAISLASALSGPAWSFPAYQSSRHTPTPIEAKEPVASVRACPSDLPVAMSFIDEEADTQTFFVLPDDLPVVLRKLAHGK